MICVVALIATIATVNAAALTACKNMTMLRFKDDKCTKIYEPKKDEKGRKPLEVWPKDEAKCLKVNKTSDDVFLPAGASMSAPATYIKRQCSATEYRATLHAEDTCKVDTTVKSTIPIDPKAGASNCTKIEDTKAKVTWYVALFTDDKKATDIYYASGGKNLTKKTSGAMALKAAAAVALTFAATHI